MSHRIIALVCLVGLLGLVPSTTADVRTSRHNLARVLAPSTEASEVCIFCHTPEGVPAVQAALGPAWVPTARLQITFTLYAGAEGDSDAFSAGPTSHSLVCLSCHDGSHAPNTGIASPGKDHPWGVPYRGAIEALSPRIDPITGLAPTTMEIAQAGARYEEFNSAVSSVIGGRRVWWVPRNAASNLRTRFDIPLYSRGGAGTEVPFVECASCHDPHSDQALFLRIANVGSGLCYTCHAK